MNRIVLLKILDALVGKVLCLLLPAPVRTDQEPRDVGKMLIIRPGGIGDAVLLIPVITELQRTFPGIVIHVLAEKRNSAVFQFCPPVRSVFHYDKPSELLTVIRGKYDAIIDAEQWHRLSAVVARLTRAQILIGFATNERKRLFTHPVPYSLLDDELVSFFHLLAPLKGGGTIPARSPWITLPPECKDTAQPFLRPFQGRRFVALFPGGSISEKIWPVENFDQIARLLVKKGYSIIIVGSKQDAARSGKIGIGLPQRLDLCGKLLLAETAATVKASSLLITGDSGLMHIASGLGVPVLALFGPGSEKKWGARGQKSRVISAPIECRPCSRFGYTPRCNIDAACMKQISVEEVYAAAIKSLEGE
jgi:ADP-heptose:LPS heptosyltransferase